jgi:predicted transcriptional regulator of viral defense system
MGAMPEAGRETGKLVPFLGQASVDRAIATLASRQHAVIALGELLALGLTESAVRKRHATGRLHRIHTGVYALVPGSLLSREGHWMAAVLACGPTAVLSHRTAAALHDLRPTARANIDVTVPGRSCRRRKGIDVHRSTTVTAADTTIVSGIPCTTVARTMFDLAEVVNRRSVERAFDQAEILEVFDLRSLEDQVARHPTRRAARVVRSVLDEHYIGSTPTRSELEEAFLALCRRLGLPEPGVNRWIDLHDGLPMIWADFVWPAQRVIVETDGDRFHGTHQARERDPRRDQRAMVAGWRPIRTTWRQVMRRPQELEPTLLALVRQPPPGASGLTAAVVVPAPRPPETPPVDGSSASDRRASRSP